MPDASVLPPVALTIAGSDPSGGAGIQADLKTFHQLHVYGAAAITLLTVQNTVGVTRVELMPPDLIVQQVEAVLADIPPKAAKTGALGGIAAIEAIAAIQFCCPLVVDPVMISKHGAPLMEITARQALREKLLPLATLITPNLHEAEAICGLPVATVPQMRDAAKRILDLGAKAVLVKGGHLEGDAVDILLTADGFREYRSQRFATRHTHGTGCTYSAAITAFLARGLSLPGAVEAAKNFITNAIRTAPGLGAGNGPVNHWV